MLMAIQVAVTSNIIFCIQQMQSNEINSGSAVSSRM